MIEFLPWYQSGAEIFRCSLCGSMVLSGDAETHANWHERKD